MPNIVVALLLGIGGSVWVYNKLYSQTGGNAQNAAIAAAVVGVGLFAVMLLILSAISQQTA